MTALLVLSCALMQSAWVVTPGGYTLGDTVVFERLVPLAEPAVRLRVSALEPSPAFQPIRPPAVVYATGGALIRYVIAPFEPGQFTIDVPAVDLLYPDGRIESTPGGVVILTPTSVLPDRAASDTLPEPRWSQAPVPTATSRIDPAIVLAWLAVTLSVVWGFLRRRVGPRPEWPASTSPAEPPVTRWVSAGEPRAVAALVMNRLRGRIAALAPAANEALSVQQCIGVLKAERPHWPLDRLNEVLNGLARASFAPAVPSDVLVVVDDMEELLEVIERADRKAVVETPAGN